MRAIFIFLSGIFLIPHFLFGQVSQGGHPLEPEVLKSAEISVYTLPKVTNEKLLKAATQKYNSASGLKPFQFAHAFTVALDPGNSGSWATAENGTRIWRLKIKSEGAKSLNIIFSNFKLPEGARLFLFNKKVNYYLGAFTSFNNKISGKFAVAPVAGDELTVQYEIPANYDSGNDFVITRVNHDFAGILKSGDRRPLGKSAGDCNIDINCDLGSDWKEIKNAVCRLIVNGKEICTGTLVNNTANDQKPYILSAAHCYDKWEYAETTVYTFNYESPYCAPLDGDPSNSVSGAVMRAQFDSLDFALAEMSLVPPPEYRPYFAGWDRSGSIPDSTVSIHHPQGDIKKIAIDRDPPLFASFSSEYIKNGFIKIVRWEDGVTEAGSSGGALFNPQKNIIGTLTGGSALCSNPVNDYFERLDLSWNFKPDSSKQLKYWLDPLHSEVQSLEGKQFNHDENLCMAFTNLTDNDEHRLVPLKTSGGFSGYWGGSNNEGITEFVEQFSIDGNEQLAGISLGVGKVQDAFGGGDSEIKIKVYNGTNLPETMIYSKTVKIKDFVEDAMNFIGFEESVEPEDTFFIGFEMSNVNAQDSFAVYQSLRISTEANFFYFKQNGVWRNFKESNENNYSMSNVFELVACNVSGNLSDTPLVNNPLEILVYPNPASSVITLEAGQDILPENISVFNLLGKLVNYSLWNRQKRKIEIDLSGNDPGVYFVRFNNGKNFVTQKISFVPW
ncbi:MAG: T9SS type A sorting domain-containing protein [Prolixibacteraceae bacterium]|nr:T9SS type A sorting domain-containing protein [Prolixibacteraceae bacterium]